MIHTGKEITLDEIRLAQAEIAVEMGKGGLDKQGMETLEQASLHLRNLERVLTSTLQKQLIASLKKECLSLNSLTEEMKAASDRLGRINDLLRKIVQTTGQVIDILELVK